MATVEGVREAHRGELTLAGVPLVQYAAIVAAQADLVPLDDVLELEGIDSARWHRAKQAFTTRLCADEASFASYQSRLIEAEDRLSRRVIPLDDDMGSWASFLAHCQTAGAARLLRRHELHPNDLARLERLWSWKLDNPMLLKRVKFLAERERTKPSELPPIHVGPTVLRPSPAARERPRTAAKPAEAGGILSCDLDTFARLDCLLRAYPDERAVVFARAGMSPEVGEQVERAWRAVIARDAVARADFRARCAHHERALRLGRGGRAPERFALDHPLSEVPSLAAPRVAIASRVAPPVQPAPLAPPASLDETSALVWPVAAALPFERPHASVDETSAVLTPLGEVLPFHGSSEAPRRPPTAPSQATGSRDLDGTSPDVGGLGPPLPFGFAAPLSEAQEIAEPVAPSTPASGASSTRSFVLRIPVREIEVELRRACGGSLDATSALVPSLLSLAPIPFPNRAGQAEPDADVAAVAPEPPPVEGSAAAVELTLAQYASLCAELALYPDRPGQVLRRYGLESADAKRALDARWSSRAESDPPVQRDFWMFYQQYVAWLRSHR